MAKFFFLFIIIIFIQVYSPIFINPYELIDSSYPVLLSTSSNEYNYLVTSGKCLKITIEDGIIQETEDFVVYDQNFIFLYDNSHKNYIYYSNKYYYIKYSPFASHEEISVSSKSKIPGNYPMVNIGSIAQNSEFIVYGLYNDYLIFSSQTEEYRASTQIFNIDNKLSCKFIVDNEFICAMIISSKIKLAFLEYKNAILYPHLKELDLYDTVSYDQSNEYSILALYDTNSNDIKLLCGEKNQNIKCRFFKRKITKNIIKDSWSIDYLGDENIVYESEYFSEKDCYLTSFNSEYLFCCASKDFIKCFQINQDNFEFKEFLLLIPGVNTYLSIKSNSNKFITLFYMNENKVYEYYIYIPTCEDKSFTIINSLNENKSGDEIIKIKNLFEVKTNKYYLKLNDKLEDIGYFKLGVTRIDSNTYKSLVPNDDTIFDFIVVNKELAKNQLKTIKYIVSVEDEEVYETECTINLSFKSCYHSCEICSADESQSNADNHNCLKCQTNYYPSPITNTNCYTIDEKNINWYFDSENSKFGICDSSCRSCSGPNDNQCLSCDTDLYLYNDICMDHCPEGNYPILKQLYGIDYYECEACYDNCLTCSEKGNNENMKCLKCKENYIRYENNCFRVEDPNSLSFYDPFTDSVSSCFQKYCMYIKENTFECIPGIDNGYHNL